MSKQALIDLAILILFLIWAFILGWAFGGEIYRRFKKWRKT